MYSTFCRSPLNARQIAISFCGGGGAGSNFSSGSGSGTYFITQTNLLPGTFVTISAVVGSPGISSLTLSNGASPTSTTLSLAVGTASTPITYIAYAGASGAAIQTSVTGTILPNVPVIAGAGGGGGGGEDRAGQQGIGFNGGVAGTFGGNGGNGNLVILGGTLDGQNATADSINSGVPTRTVTFYGGGGGGGQTTVTNPGINAVSDYGTGGFSNGHSGGKKANEVIVTAVLGAQIGYAGGGASALGDGGANDPNTAGVTRPPGFCAGGSGNQNGGAGRLTVMFLP